MSEQTHAALEAAVQAHVRDENDGALTTAWVLQTAAVLPDRDDVVRMHNVGPADQPLHVTLGLVDYLHTIIRADLARPRED